MYADILTPLEGSPVPCESTGIPFWDDPYAQKSAGDTGKDICCHCQDYLTMDDQSEDADLITGQEIFVDGGRSKRRVYHDGRGWRDPPQGTI